MCLDSDKLTTVIGRYPTPYRFRLDIQVEIMKIILLCNIFYILVNTVCEAGNQGKCLPNCTSEFPIDNGPCCDDGGGNRCCLKCSKSTSVCQLWFGFGVWCQRPLSTIFQLHRAHQFY